ncbi:MAG: membrane protein insertase YidC [Deltaproteobacteria bacterium]|nr:membrane protein insertase YidC [Deltaproteobacteria bacterium]
MDKRAIIAIILSMIVILIWQVVFMPPPKKKPVVEEKGFQGARVEEAEGARTGGEILEYSGGGEVRVQDVVVETPLYRAVFTTAGGRLKSWRLKKYMDSVETVVLWRRKPVRPPEPVEMVSMRRVKDLPLEVGVELGGRSIKQPVFDVNASSISLASGEDGSIVFLGKTGEGLEILKRYRFYGGEYRVDLDVEIINRGGTPVEPGVRLIWRGVVKGGGRYTFAGPSVLAGKSVDRLSVREIKKGKVFSGDVKWMAAENTSPPPGRPSEGNYFVSLIVPRERKGIEVSVHEIEAPGSQGVGFESTLTFQNREVEPGKDRRYGFLLYLGPKLPELLRDLDVEAEKVINFGKYLGGIEKVLLRILGWTHRVTGNYGVDIVILSILLKVIFWPLSRKSYRSMQEMQKIQPEMKMLQEKYKDDKQRLNQEMMALYKRRKVNPVGGCLPMLVQFPFLIALYKALPLFFNLRHAPFVLWIRDLAAADSFFVDELPLPLLGHTPVGPLPLLMGVSMVIQQRMTPTAGDPRQAKMMMIMPIMFIFIFLSFPSGLVLYWFVQNVLSIGEQYYTRKKGR